MIKIYLKNAWRNLLHNRVFSLINITGLTVGLASFILIALYIFDELTFDRFHKNANYIFRIVNNRTSNDGKKIKIAGAGFMVSEASKQNLPEIKNVARLLTLGRSNISTAENNNVFYEDFIMGNPGFLTLFDFKLIAGDRNTALTTPHSVIVTEETAQKLFGTTNVIGKIIKADRDTIPFQVTGVLKNFPVNSHLFFHLLFSESSFTNPEFEKFKSNDYSSDAFMTYILLSEKSSVPSVEAKINNLVNERVKKEERKSDFLLQPLKSIHFHSAGIEGNSGRTGNITYTWVFSILGIFVLLIACFNYINLTTASFASRSKEIAMRKVAGASRTDLAAQFLSEALLITSISTALALVIVELALPSFNTFTQKELTLGAQTDLRLWISVIGLIIIVGLLSGVYPALFQSRLNPLRLIKNKINVGKNNLSLRRSLVVFQFALSITMIIATMIVYLQMRYIGTKDLGFNLEQLLVVDINSAKVRRDAATIKNAMENISGVEKVTVSSRVPGEWKDLPKIKVKNEKIADVGGNDMYFLGIDYSFLKTYNISLSSGRNFAQNSQADSDAVIINETAARQLGIVHPTEQLIEIPLAQPFHARVVGIVKDFNFQSLRQPLAPMVLGFEKNPVQSIDYFTLRVSGKNIIETIAKVDAILHSTDQSHLFEYHFLDKQWDLFYLDDQIRETIFLIVALLMIFIACLGLFGLATYSAKQRIKEIGIRKVLGATSAGIVALLTKDFLRLVIIAAVIAFPFSWWMMKNWLLDFAYRINISWWVFIIATLVALFIALFTTSIQALKTAITNPVNSLRSE